jgi:hypothetical protein
VGAPDLLYGRSRAAFLKPLSSGDHFYWSECSTDRPTVVRFESKLFEIINYSVWYVIHVNFIFSVFFGPMFNLRGPQGQNPRTTCVPRTTVWETLTQKITRNIQKTAEPSNQQLQAYVSVPKSFMKFTFSKVYRVTQKILLCTSVHFSVGTLLRQRTNESVRTAQRTVGINATLSWRPIHLFYCSLKTIHTSLPPPPPPSTPPPPKKKILPCIPLLSSSHF